MPHALTDLQKEYLEFIRGYVSTNESSPRLDEIANHFKVKAPTAHKTLKALESKGYLIFGRDSNSGFFIRLIERAGSAEIVLEVPIAGKVDKFGELHDFPSNQGHFASVFNGTDPEKIFAIGVQEDLPQASILTNDLIIFDSGKKPQPGDICITFVGDRLFLIKIFSNTYDHETLSLNLAMPYPIPENLTNPELGQLLNWVPLAYDDDTHDWFMKVAEEQNWSPAPLSPNLILATALRLSRALAF